MTDEFERFPPEPPSSVNMPLLVLARACTTTVFMTYSACLGWLMDAWQMTATRAGVVQGAFTASFAVSLLVVSFLCDRSGAKSVSEPKEIEHGRPLLAAVKGGKLWAKHIKQYTHLGGHDDQ